MGKQSKCWAGNIKEWVSCRISTLALYPEKEQLEDVCDWCFHRDTTSIQIKGYRMR